MNAIKRWIAIVAVTIVMMTALPTAAMAATAGFDVNHCQVIVAGDMPASPNVKFYSGGAAVAADAMTWVEDAERGKVLSLDGNTQYMSLRAVGADENTPFELTALSFSAWVNFQGSNTDDDTDPVGQYLFSIPGETHCFEISPWVRDDTQVAQNGFSLNGLCTKFYNLDSTLGEIPRVEYTPVQAAYSNTALPQDEWHHIAVVIDTYVKMYLDGELLYESVIGVPVRQMYPIEMFVGRGYAEHTQMYTLLDDTMVFDTALTDTQVRALMFSGDATVAVKTDAELSAMPELSATTTVYMPTTTSTAEPTTTTTHPNAIAQDDKPMGIPLWGFAICLGIISVALVLALIVNIYEFAWSKANRRDLEAFAKEHNMTVEEVIMHAKAARKKKIAQARAKKMAKRSKKKGGEQPALSLKQAAKLKREEEHAKFLAEEAKEEAEKGDEEDA